MLTKMYLRGIASITGVAAFIGLTVALTAGPVQSNGADTVRVAALQTSSIRAVPNDGGLEWG